MSLHTCFCCVFWTLFLNHVCLYELVLAATLPVLEYATPELSRDAPWTLHSPFESQGMDVGSPGDGGNWRIQNSYLLINLWAFPNINFFHLPERSQMLFSIQYLAFTFPSPPSHQLASWGHCQYNLEILWRFWAKTRRDLSRHCMCDLPRHFQMLLSLYLFLRGEGGRIEINSVKVFLLRTIFKKYKLLKAKWQLGLVTKAYINLVNCEDVERNIKILGKR